MIPVSELVEGMSASALRRLFSGDHRVMVREANAVVRKANVTAGKVNALAHVAMTAQDCLLDLENNRTLSAGNNEFLREMMGLIEIRFVNSAMRIQDKMF